MIEFCGGVWEWGVVVVVVVGGGGRYLDINWRLFRCEIVITFSHRKKKSKSKLRARNRDPHRLYNSLQNCCVLRIHGTELEYSDHG